MKKIAFYAAYLVALILVGLFSFVAGQWREAYVHSRVSFLSALMIEKKLEAQKFDSAGLDNCVRAQAAYRMINSIPHWISQQPGTRPVSAALQAERATELRRALLRVGEDVPQAKLNSFVAQHLSRSELFSVTVR